MNQKIIALILLGLLITVIWSSFGIYTGTKTPILSVGDHWRYLAVDKYGKYYSTEIIDRREDFEGVQCYVLIHNESQITETVWMTSDWLMLKTYMEEKFPYNSYFRKYEPGLKLYDFPLIIGREWGTKSHITITEGNETDTWYSEGGMDWIRNVVSRETITVPAGTFETYVIEEFNSRGVNTRYWFSVDAKNYVKMEYFGENVMGDGEIILLNYELVPQENEQKNLLFIIALSAAIGVLGITSLIYNRRDKSTREI
jgi:hypothetical protein